MDNKSYYDILGVPKTASQDEIKSAFRKLARQYHPDLHPDDATAAEKFKEINEAYETLGDEKKRAAYDNPQPDMGGFDFRGFTGGQGFGGGMFDDIFGNIFGGASRGGGDISTSITLTFEEAAFGTTKEVSLNRVEECADCRGTGAKNGTEYTKCTNCGGTGVIQQVQQTLFGQMANSRPCPRCGGRGKIIKEPCAKCGGKGTIKKASKIRLNFPPGLENDQTVSVRGEGNVVGGRKGNLNIHIKVTPHKYFRRDGQNLYMEYPITFTQALLGDRVNIKNLKGSDVALNIPEGTQSGAVLTIRGGGLEYGRRKGDILVKVVVEMPKGLTREQRNLVRELQESIKLNQYDKVKNFNK